MIVINRLDLIQRAWGFINCLVPGDKPVVINKTKRKRNIPSLLFYIQSA